MVFPDHTACTDPGNIVGGGGVQAYPPQVYFSHSLNLQRSNGKFFIKKPIISKTPEGVQHFPGGGGSNFPGGGGG